MKSVVGDSRIIRFGAFELDVHAGELRKQGLKVRLQEQPLRILQMLVSNPGELVSREELRAALWPSNSYLDFDQGLNRAINKLREALGDSAEGPRFIETLAKRGYRFLHPMTNAVPEASIAVLPFLNLSTDPENELFADGMTEEIISTLSHIKNIHVVARTSSFSFKGKHLDLRSIGQQLNVRTILEGSVRRSGDRLRITSQLVNAEDGYHLWSQQYDRKMEDIFGIQEEIARSIAQTLEVTLDLEGKPLRGAGTENLEAFKLYVRGLSHFFQRPARLNAAVECLKNAVALDPHYALAWSGLADAYHMVGFYGLASPEHCMPQGKLAATRSIELDPSLAEAHTSLAVSHLLHEWDWSSAEREFLHSLGLKPHNALARAWYGLFYLQWAAGRFEEGLAQVRRAVQIDPLSASTRAILVHAYLPIDPDRSVETALETLQTDLESYTARWGQITALNLLGRFAEAAAVGETVLRSFGRPLWVMASLARTYARLGKKSDSEALYMEFKWRAKREYLEPLWLGLAAFAAGEKDEAMRLVQHAHAIGVPTLLAGKYWPDFVEMREDLRFQEILRARGWT
jgi:TolB-like protein